MSWVIRLSMASQADFRVIGPGLAYLPESGCVYVDVPEALDAYRASKAEPRGQGSIPYAAAEWIPVVLGCLDGLKDMRRPVKSLAVQLERWDARKHRKGRD